MSSLVLYHGTGNCHDGFMAALLMKLFFKGIDEKVDTQAVHYHQPMPDVADKHVYIVDFCYPQEELLKAAQVAKSITVIDHHESAADYFGGYGFHEFKNVGAPVKIYLKKDQSGAKQVQHYLKNELDLSRVAFDFLYNRRMEMAINAVSDRDLWNFELPYTAIYHELLCMIGYTFDQWEHVLLREDDEVFQRRYERAFHYWEVKDNLATIYAQQLDMINFNGHVVPIVNCPKNFASIVGDKLNKKYPFSMSFDIVDDMLRVDFRSDKKTGINVKEIAKTYGGGGHEHSSGCALTIDKLVPLLEGKL